MGFWIGGAFCISLLWYASIVILIIFVILGIYFGKPRGFGTNENGEEIGFNTEVYAAYEVII